jgi:hypothetical protein
MKGLPPFDLMRDLVDAELFDSNEVPCGRVDDVQLELTARGLEVVALLVGPGAWQARLPALLRVVARVLFGHHRVRVPAAEIAQIAEVVRLRSPAATLGLGIADRRTGRGLTRFPGT